MSQPCPCGSALDYSVCCGPYLSATHFPQYPTQLMRSRYCAFVLKNVDYLINTWHPTVQAASLRAEIAAGFAGTEWRGLTIVNAEPGATAQEGFVTFVARYQDDDKCGAIIERSRFLKENARWYYIDGTRPQYGRNDPCPCGSVKKFKKCCGL